MKNVAIRELHIESHNFNVTMIGSMYYWCMLCEQLLSNYHNDFTMNLYHSSFE